MGRGSKRTTRRRVQQKEKGSDESDEEYRVAEDEEFDESDEYCSLDGDESEELLAEFDEYEEDDEEEKKVKRVVRSKTARKSFFKRKANRIKKPQKRRRVSHKAKEDEEEEEDDYEDEDEDEDDEEFMLDESDCVDEEDEMPVIKKNKKESRPPSQKRGFSKGRKRSRKSKVLKKTTSQKSGKNRRLTRKTSSANNGEVTKKNLVVEEKSRNISARRKRRAMVDSDSDFVSSVSSDFEYTISEEEREQVREASKFCTNLKTSLRSSSLVKRSQEEETMCPQRRRTGRKGKEKVEDKKNEVVKQVCGICLSEEVKKTVQGTLNCCSHYFCFACIMEWSKVESRCPLCKQRFITISKPARSNTGFDLRTVVIQVPERDQVYQPSEEELRGYLDPYENVICTECQQGGEDALMLLCDICDSPAHTFCVGLGHEVPEGNWYCEGCRPSALASLNPQGLSPTPDRRANNMSGPASPFPGGIDLNALYVPETPLTQETGTFSSLRRPIGDHRAISSSSGPGAVTVLQRRRIQRHVHTLLNNRMSQEIIRSNGISASSSGIRLFGSQLDQGRGLIPPQTLIPETAVPLYNNTEGRLEGNTFSLARNRDLFSARSGHLRGQVQNQTSTSVAGRPGPLQAEHGGFGMAFNPSLVHEQLHPCTSRSSIGTDASPTPYACREVSHFNVEKGQVQQMVRSHLKSLSRDIELGYGIFKDISRRSTHTVLAACRLEHRGSEVHPVEPSLICNHLGVAGAEMSLMRDYCSSCFNLFVKDVVRQITNAMQVSPMIGV